MTELMKSIEYYGIERPLVLKVDVEAALYALQQPGRGQDLIAPHFIIPVLEVCASCGTIYLKECG